MTQALTLHRPLESVRTTALHWREQARALIRAHPRGALGLGVLSLVGFVAIGGIVVPNPATNPSAHAAAPAPPPLILQSIAPQQALKVNAEIPLTGGPNPAAAPFNFTGSTRRGRRR